jgi:Ni,Fe-hydrogenase I small subunit
MPATGNSQLKDSIREIDVLWITAGLGCDGDNIAMTGAIQPSIEDIVMGGGCPNIGGICIGCTMPGFPDKFRPFMNQPRARYSRRTQSRLMAARFMRFADLRKPRSIKSRPGGSVTPE